MYKVFESFVEVISYGECIQRIKLCFEFNRPSFGSFHLPATQQNMTPGCFLFNEALSLTFFVVFCLLELPKY